MTAKRRTKGTGNTRQLASGRWQARFAGPDGIMRPAPVTFDTKLDADGWLRSQARDVDRGTWTPPTDNMPTARRGVRVRDYADTWLDQRDLKPSTRYLYRKLIDDVIAPSLGDAYLDAVKPTTVRAWHAGLGDKTPT